MRYEKERRKGTGNGSRKGKNRICECGRKEEGTGKGRPGREEGVMGTKGTKGTGGAVTVFVTHSNAVFYVINLVLLPLIMVYMYCGSHHPHFLFLTSLI